ncbi:MAG: peptide chain release factor N(5)-glutamine methyltransferase [Acidobacteriia bacterium]|nr:peptide chain release factor N(5)-glutamine methyltransferase [Terriglobia bacterium]
MMTLKQVTDAAVDFFQDNEVPSPRLNAELLLMFILGCDRSYLYAHPERQLKPEEDARYREVVRERASGCPTQYITGHQEFWGLDLIVSPSVLIPRPETEHVVETTVELVRLRDPEQPLRMIDVGTGSGCIALALASEFPKAEIHASDLSDEALEIARINAARLRLDQVQFRKSNLLGAYPGEHFDFVISNPPYVGESEADKVQKQVKDFEPHMAVFSGLEGMDIYKRLVPQAEEAVNSGGWLVMEIGFSAEARVKELLVGWAEVITTADLQGIPRVVAARKA